MTLQKYVPPTLAQIHAENDDAFGQSNLKHIVNQPPPEKWIKKHPMSGVAYVPVEKVEYLLDKIFQRWKVDIISVRQECNSMLAVVRLWYWNPQVTRYLVNGDKLVYDKEGQPVVIYGEWDYHDGTGAAPIQTDKGESAANLAAIKNDAIGKAAPAAVSYAIKDAADHIGIIFGRNVARKDSIPFEAPFKEDPAAPKADIEPATTVTVVVDTPPPPPPPPPPPAPVAAPAIVVDATPPVFDADFFSADGLGEQTPDPNNQEIDF